MDEIIDDLYCNVTRKYWNKERNYIDANYATIPFYVKEIKTPEFKIIKEMTLDQLMGYLRTWSGVKHYMRVQQHDPVNHVSDRLKKDWVANKTLKIVWPVYMRAGNVER